MIAVAAAVMVGLAACGAPEEVYNPQPPQAPIGGDVELPLDESTVPSREYVGLLLQAEAFCDGIDAPTLAAQIEAESNWNPGAQSPAGAQGIAQFMPATWAEYGIDGNGDGVADVFDPSDAIPSQGRFMCGLRAGVTDAQDAGDLPTGQSLELALAAYNAGLAAVLQHRAVPPYPETQTYVPTILTRRMHYAQTPVGLPPIDGYPAAPTACAPSGDPLEAGLLDPALRGLRCVHQVFPHSTITSGWRERGSTSNSDHPLGLAIDVASATHSWDSAEGRRQMWQIAHWYQVNADRLGVKYIIFHNYRWPDAVTGQRVWVPYTHGSGAQNPSLDHHDHVHLSFHLDGGSLDAALIDHAPRQGEHPRGIWMSPDQALRRPQEDN